MIMSHGRRHRVLLATLALVSCCCRPSLTFLIPATYLRSSVAVYCTRDQTRARRQYSTAGLLQRNSADCTYGDAAARNFGAAHRRNRRRLCMTSTGSEEGDLAREAARAAATSTPIQPPKDSQSPDSFPGSVVTSTKGVTISPGNEDKEEDAIPLKLDKAFEEGINRALRGDAGVLRQVLAPDVVWRGPLGQNIGFEAVNNELKGLGQLLSDPNLSVFAYSQSGAIELEWIASGTWRLPWLPRFIVRGKSVIDIGAHGKVTQISDSWEGNIIGLTLKHLVPGFWDIWHQLGSPPAEKIPYKVLKKAWEYEIREYAPRLVYQPSLIDRSNSRELRMALILPGFAHNGELKTTGRNPDEYFVAAPVEVSIQPFIETGFIPNGTWFNGTVREASTSRRANRITWTVPAPTAMGLDVTALPPPAKEREKGEGQRARYARQGFRRIAVASFNGLPQDPEAAEVRTRLLSNLAADGVTPNKGDDGRVRSGIMMHNSRGCFDKKGRLSMSILYHRPKFIGIGNEVFVELDDEEKVTEAGVWGGEGGSTDADAWGDEGGSTEAGVWGDKGESTQAGAWGDESEVTGDTTTA